MLSLCPIQSGLLVSLILPINDNHINDLFLTTFKFPLHQKHGHASPSYQLVWMGTRIQQFLPFPFMFLQDKSITKSNKRGCFSTDLTISDVPGAAVKTFLAERHSKWLIAVINPVAEDGDCMLAGVRTVLDYTNNKHVFVHVIKPVKIF